MENEIIENAKKDKHAAAVKRYSKRKTLVNKWLKGNIYRLADELIRLEVVDKLSPESKEFILKVEKYKPRRVPQTLMKLFKGVPSEGDFVTAKDVLERIYKGEAEMRALIRKWQKIGVEVRYEIDPEGSRLEAKYVVDRLPDNYAGCDLDPDEFMTRTDWE